MSSLRSPTGDVFIAGSLFRFSVIGKCHFSFVLGLSYSGVVHLFPGHYTGHTRLPGSPTVSKCKTLFGWVYDKCPTGRNGFRWPFLRSVVLCSVSMPAAQPCVAKRHTRPTPRKLCEGADRWLDTFRCRAERVVGGSPGKTWSPHSPVRADVPRQGASPRRALSVLWRVSAG